MGFVGEIHIAPNRVNVKTTYHRRQGSQNNQRQFVNRQLSDNRPPPRYRRTSGNRGPMHNRQNSRTRDNQTYVNGHRRQYDRRRDNGPVKTSNA